MSSQDTDINVEDGMVETTRDLSKDKLANEDIEPTNIDRRTWGTWDISALWISMCITIALYFAISGMVASGLNLTQTLLSVLIGTFIIFIPLVLNGHPGTKYGIPFPVLIRSSFGIHGAHFPAIFRGLVACGWFGVQCWIGGEAIHVAMVKLESLTGLTWLWPSNDAAWVGLNLLFEPGAGIFLGFFVFWAISMWIVWRGIESIRWLEVFGAPFLILCFLGLFAWAWVEGGGFWHILSEGMEQIGAAEGLEGQEFWLVFVPQIMAIIGYWATLSLNIPDFTRYCKSQKTQATGQFIGLNFTMVPFAFVIVFITAGAFLIYMPEFAKEELQPVVKDNAKVQRALEIESGLEGDELDQAISSVLQNNSYEEILTLAKQNNVSEPVESAIQTARSRAKSFWNPMKLLGAFDTPWVVILVMLGFAIATLTTNMAANVVAPANSFSNLLPQRISFRMGGLITGVIGILTFPWVLISEPAFYIDLWLNGAAAVLAPIGGIMIADYFIYRKTKLQLEELYEFDGSYFYSNGFNIAGITTLIISFLIMLPGWLLKLFVQLGTVPFLNDFKESDMTLAPWLFEQGYTTLSAFSWIYLINWIFGFIFSIICYSILAKWIYGQANEPNPEELVS